MVSITWHNKLRIDVKYLKQFFLMPRFCKSLKIVSELVNGKQVWLCILIKMPFGRAETGGGLSSMLQAFTAID